MKKEAFLRALGAAGDMGVVTLDPALLGSVAPGGQAQGEVKFGVTWRWEGRAGAFCQSWPGPPPPEPTSQFGQQF